MKDPLVFFFVLAAFIVAAILDNPAPEVCSTDTECMQQRGGDGGPGE